MTFSRRLGMLCAAGVLLLLRPAAAAVPDSTTYDPGRAAFAVRFGEEVIAHRIMAVPVTPDTSVRMAIASDTAAGPYQVDAPEASIRPLSGSAWRFTAPAQPGLYPVTITAPSTADSVRIQVFVLRTWDHEGRRLNGYHIGYYEMNPRRGLEVYEPPDGFIKVTAENKNAPLSPNFRLEQFLCKQTDETPQYALVRTRLLQQLERILAAVNARGHPVPTLHVMSGYRTPQYNRAIGNTTEYSRHLYGDAADLFVDADDNRWMDDLNGDGRATKTDAQVLARIVRSVGTPGDDRFNGGLSVYGPTNQHGPFVHIDLRGHRVRW
jgi:hypothetical protein